MVAASNIPYKFLILWTEACCFWCGLRFPSIFPCKINVRIQFRGYLSMWTKYDNWRSFTMLYNCLLSRTSSFVKRAVQEIRSQLKNRMLYHHITQQQWETNWMRYSPTFGFIGDGHRVTSYFTASNVFRFFELFKVVSCSAKTNIIEEIKTGILKK